MVSAIAESFVGSDQALEQAEASSVKLLDLLTNRYHAGVLRQDGHGGLRVEVPASARMRVGQRVRCIVAPHSSGVLSRRHMRRASILHVEASATTPNLLLELAFMDDPTAS
jgi:hypothetical protein